MRYLILIYSLTILSCGDEVVVKPNAMFMLEYQEPSYDTIAVDCPFEFLVNTEAVLKGKNNCWMNIHYPKMNATLYLSYREVNEKRNIDSLLYDAQKLTYDHTIKAESILEQPRVDSINKVYGRVYMINGNAATQSQFYVTDSIRHFVNGSLYFDSKPNFDSLYPAVVYLRNDIRRIMESIRWK